MGRKRDIKLAESRQGRNIYSPQHVLTLGFMAHQKYFWLTALRETTS
jgi:hypothetical protein